MQLLSLLKELSLHPKNAEELKGLILQLAVEGKLTAKWRDKNQSIGTIHSLLDRIDAEKKELVRQKIIKKSKPLDEILEDEKYFSIPDSWCWERLGTIGNIFNGNSVNKSVKESKYMGLDSGYPYIGTKDVGYGFDTINHDNGVKIPHDEPKFKIARKGTVLICSEGGSAGKKMGVLNEDSCFGNKLYAIEQYGGIESTYILSLYGASSFSQAFKNKMTGIIGGISRNNFADLLIPLPPIEEQKAIVEVVNQLFAEVEQLEELTKERISLKEDFVTSALSRLTSSDNTASEWNLLKDQFSTFFTEASGVKKLRETILQLAVQGKLTAKWRANNPNIEPASELLKRIEAEKQQLIAEKKIKKEKPLPPIVDDEIPYELPVGWVWCRMGQIAEKLGAGSTPSGGKSAYVDEGIMFFRSQNIYNHYLKLQDVALIPESTHEKMKGTKVKPKDILLNITGGSIGRCSLIPDDFTTANVSQHVAIVRMVELEIRKYIHQFVISPGFQDRIMDVQVGVSREGLSMTKLKMFPTPLPPLEEQKAIVEKVNSLMTLCDELEQQIETSHIQVEQLMQSCLKEVFEG